MESVMTLAALHCPDLKNMKLWLNGCCSSLAQSLWLKKTIVGTVPSRQNENAI